MKSHIGIHGNEMADKLANTAEDECCMGRHFDYDLSNDTHNHSGTSTGCNKPSRFRQLALEIWMTH